jgi:hypothetical protein
VEPQFNSFESPLPALLTHRHTSRTIRETNASIQRLEKDLAGARARLEQEQASLRDSRRIAEGLEKRTDELRGEKNRKSQKSPDESAKKLIAQLQRRRTGYETEIKRLVKAFNSFIDNHLAAMLAAEELGGPVVGDLMDIDDGLLHGDFSTQGKARKGKGPKDESQRQRRIDQIWGLEEANEDHDRSEKAAAGAEVRALTEELLNASAGASGSASYVGLQRDSAAARFLVRSKVAQVHPKDAWRLRLIDFGRDIED